MGYNRRDARRVEAATKFVERRPRNAAAGPGPPVYCLPLRTFYTTSGIAAATVTGTTTATAVRSPGAGTARPCIVNASGNTIPDPHASDVAVFNHVVMTGGAAIPASRFVDCAWVMGHWAVLMVQSCT
jgi:hypothetical protein